MAASQDLLKETVFQLLSHNQSLDKTLSEVSSLKQTCKDGIMFARLSEYGCLPFLQSHDQTDELICSTDMCIDRITSLCTGNDRMSEDKEAEIQSLLLMLKQLKQTGKLNVSRFNDKLCNHPRIPLYVLWTLHKEGIFSLENYFRMQKGRVNVVETFVCKMCQASKSEQSEISDMLSELLHLGFSEGNTDKGSIVNTAVDIIDRFFTSVVEEAVQEKNEARVISLSSVHLNIETLRRAYTHILTVILSHKPVLKVSQAIREQQDWAYGRISPSVTQLFKQFLLPFDMKEVLTLLRQILEQQEVNWQLLLSFVSVSTVCMPETTKLFLEFTDSLLQEGLDSCEIETTIMGMLLARQACFQGPHVFLAYSDWFQRTFSDGSRSLASTRKSFTFLMKFLTDLVPYESAQHIKVHILHPPFVPAKCRQLLTDYIVLAKTRLEDLKESMDMPGVEDSTSANDKGKQLFSEIESVVKLFETSGKVPTLVLEASIFRKPYYIGQFLPALLQPRPLPDMPDSKMRLIAALKRADKIPMSMYNAYEKGCKREASQLLEGVFIDSDTDDEMELSPFELMENTLQQLKNTVKSREDSRTSKYTISEIMSLLCGRLENVLPLSQQVQQHSTACVTIDTENSRMESLYLKVVDALLNSVGEILQLCYTQQDPDFTWLSKLVQSISQYPALVETLYIRIFILTVKQGIYLENHHIDCVAAVLVEIQCLGKQLPCVQVRSEDQGHDGVQVRSEGQGHDGVQVGSEGQGHDGVQVRREGQGHDGVQVRREGQGHDGVQVRREGQGHDGVQVRSEDQGHDGVQVRREGQGHDGVAGKLTLSECILDQVSMRTHSWMDFSLRLTTSYIKYMFSTHEDIDQNLVIPLLIKKFMYLSTRHNAQLRYYGNRSHLFKDVVSAVYMSEHFQQFVNIFPLTVSEWIAYEISVCPNNGSLTDFQRFEYFSWIVYTYFLGTGQESYYSIASSIVQGIVNTDMRCSVTNEGCLSCSGARTMSDFNSRSVFVNLLQELTARFTPQTQEACDALPWLPQQLVNLLSAATDEIQQHCLIQQFVRLCLCLPAYLMFNDTPYMVNSQISLKCIAQFIHDVLVPHFCEGLYLPASLSAYICQGLYQVCGGTKIEELLNDLCHLSPVVMMSLLVNSYIVEPVILATLSETNLLKLGINFITGGEKRFMNSVEPWLQAAVLFSMAINSSHRDGTSVLKEFIETCTNSGHRVKVVCCLVHMLFLQLTYIQNFEVPQCNGYQEKLESVLTEALKLREGKYLVKMCFSEALEENTRSCVNEGLIKLMNLTILRYFLAHQKEGSRENVKGDKFLAGILKAYSNVLAMFGEEQSCHQLKAKPLKVEEMQSIDQFIVTSIETASPVHLRQIDQDLLLGCGPSVADCAVRALSS